ncbi:MAG: serine/threonine protein kinase [Porticoccaceae bacterium]|jgi:Ser/Thr protein kinase RdoA (MazF antagonist)|nr:serine/threonine protein kinase [Porticoccaceae bacterium]MEA3298933.1 serine/threonine protein kinase [Pseudomonadota bacterium]
MDADGNVALDDSGQGADRGGPPAGHPFDRLSPELIMAAVESAGFLCDGRFFALNSYENRVYQVGIEDSPPLIAKFYRPERWSDEQIGEEHQFCFALVEQELPVVAPLRLDGAHGGASLGHCEGFRFALYPRRGGHAPELDNLDNLHTLGKFLGRIHRVGGVEPFVHRPAIDAGSFGDESVAFVAAHFVPRDLAPVHRSVTDELLAAVRESLATLTAADYIRVHGDCHPGNILWRDELPNFVDFDDARMAPAVQDIWMLLCGERHRQQAQLGEILDGYSEFHDFEHRQLRWIEAFRALRLMYFSAWLARRWDDPAFPRAFPWFNTARYWGDHILELREQLAAFNEPTLQWL